MASAVPLRVRVDSYDFDCAIKVVRQKHPFRPWLSAKLDEAEQGIARRDPAWIEQWDDAAESGDVVIHIGAGPKFLKLCLDLAGVVL